ncbi:MAG TPA: PQQ-binding-like beta-propeller repeat protein [Chthoniobacteraceae bacterium]|jgi:outer membrane protein assembly factor BamB|nr:PQQ-binding-like beta-propeller repeat protein [Chthoniobacteraceae bacterium]
MSLAHCVVAVTLCGLAALAQAEDWPQWRGPRRDGIWRETGVLEKFPADGLKVRWRAPVGPGYSGVVVADGRAYVSDCLLEPESVERVLCFDAADGKLLWTYVYPCRYDDLFFGAGPYATPLVHAGKVYVSSPRGHLHCLNAATGKVVWARDRSRDNHAILPQSGCNSSPIIEGNLLLVMGGGRESGCVTAYDKETGDEVWAALKERPGGSSPIAIDAGGQRQVIFWTLDSVASLDPRTGQVFWQVPTKSLNDGGALTTPAAYKDYLLLVCEKAMLFRLAADKPEATLASQTWPRKTVNTFVSPVFQDEHFYYSAYRDDLCCFEVASGKQVWKTPAVTAGHSNALFQMTPHGESVFILSEDGILILARLAPEGYTELGRTFLLAPTMGTWTPASGRPKIWAQPAYANRHIFARSDQELVCASLEATP